MKAPLPLQSPSAQTPSTVVRSSSSTCDVAAGVHAIAGGLQAQVVGVGPAADGQQHVAAHTAASPPAQSTPTTSPSVGAGLKRMHSAPVAPRSPRLPGSRAPRRRRPGPRARSGASPSPPPSPPRRSAGTSGRTPGRCSCRRRPPGGAARRRVRGSRCCSSDGTSWTPGMSGTSGAAADVDEDARRGQPLAVHLALRAAPTKRAWPRIRTAAASCRRSRPRGPLRASSVTLSGAGAHGRHVDADGTRAASRHSRRRGGRPGRPWRWRPGSWWACSRCSRRCRPGACARSPPRSCPPRSGGRPAAARPGPRR